MHWWILRQLRRQRWNSCTGTGLRLQFWQQGQWQYGWDNDGGKDGRGCVSFSRTSARIVRSRSVSPLLAAHRMADRCLPVLPSYVSCFRSCDML